MPGMVLIYWAWVIWGVSWLAAALWKRRAVRAAPRQWTYVPLQLAGITLLLLWRPHALKPVWQMPSAGMWACLILTVLGFAFCWWARIHLGVYWSSNVSRKDDHRIIDTGPYRIVRHPIYTGIILASFATAAAKGTAPALAGAILLTLGWYVKARLEENFLRQELGAEEYDGYAARTAMLVPFIRL